MSEGTRSAIGALLSPRSIAVIGATERPQYGGRLVSNLLATGYRGRIIPINPRRESVFGIPCIPTIADADEEIDLAAVVIPAESVPANVVASAEKGARAAMVISAGFAELGTPESEALQDELVGAAASAGIRVCGPNCLGVANVAEGIWATANVLAPMDDRLRPGGIAIVSQSGATAFGPLLAIARQRGIGLRYVISSGNEADLTTADYVDYLVGDRYVTAIACVLEGVRDGRALRRSLEAALAADKPVVVLKIGRTETGAAAALSHTAALTGSDDAFDALLRQHGVPRAEDWGQLLELADVLGRSNRPRGSRIGIVSHSGGIGGLLADHCAAGGLDVPELAPTTRDRLAQILAGRGAARNPADVTGHFERETFEEILRLVRDDPAVDLLAVASAGGMEHAMRVAAVAEGEKPLVDCWTGGAEETDALRVLRQSAVPLTYEPSDCARALKALVRWTEARDAREEPIERCPDPRAWARLSDALAHAPPGPLPDHVGLGLLEHTGIASVPTAFAPTPEAAASTRLSFPLAVKISSPDLPHKSDVGGVRLGIRDAAELERAAREIIARLAAGARVTGFTIQEMAPDGIEVFLGARRDPALGMVVAAGLGGEMVEALGTTAWRLAPLRIQDADDLVDEAPGVARLLAGYRARPRADRRALVRAIAAFAAWADEVRDLVETAELNPLLVLPEGEGVLALDCLIVPRAALTTV